MLDGTARIENLRQRKVRTGRWILAFRKAESRFPWIRLAVLAVGLLSVFLAFQLLPFLIGWLVTGVFLVAFAWTAQRHARLTGRIDRLQAFEALLDTHIARLELEWERIPPPGTVSVPAGHPFAGDLNITGARSIHQLLDTSVSTGGSQRLASWLLQPVPDPAETLRRQGLVQELIPREAFRTRLGLNGILASTDTGHKWDTGAILTWLKKHTRAGSLRPWLIALFVAALANMSLFLLNTLGILPPLWIASMAIYLGLQSLRYRESSEVMEEAYSLGRQLGRLHTILADFETTPYRAGSALGKVAAPFTQGKPRPSTALRQVSRIISASSLRNNPFLALILNLLVPWDLFFAYELEKVKGTLRTRLPQWLEAWYEIEGLVSLANYASFHPEYCFPELLPLETQPVLDFVSVGHPLIPAQERVTNDFSLTGLGGIMLITGSNMSGKSTFLRTIGAALVLAFAGSPVPAQNMRTIPFRLFTSMNVTDSLNDGISFFYAEVRRLKALLDALEVGDAYPLLFLVDEIFRGTNNRERQIGSWAYTRALVGGNGAGFLSTHDLELANLAGENPSIKNYHFKETIQDGKMVFDFKIHPGASPTTNALRIMALAGLPLPPEKTET